MSYYVEKALAFMFTVLILLTALAIIGVAAVQATPTDDPDREISLEDQLEELPDRAVTVTEDPDLGLESLQDLQKNESEGQEQPEPTPTKEEPEELTDQIGDLDIHSYEFTEDDQGSPILLVEITWNGRSPETTTITQLPGKNADRIAISRNRVPPDKKMILRVDLVADDEPAILYTETSLRNERAVVLDPNRNTSTETTLIRGVSIGILTALLGTVAAAVRYYRVDKDPVEGWEP